MVGIARAVLFVLVIGVFPAEARAALGYDLPVVELTADQEAPAVKPSVRFARVGDGFDVRQDLSAIGPTEFSSIEFADIEFGIPDQPILVLLAREPEAAACRNSGKSLFIAPPPESSPSSL